MDPLQGLVWTGPKGVGLAHERLRVRVYQLQNCNLALNVWAIFVESFGCSREMGKLAHAVARLCLEGL
eukprot:3129546-Pyramimonas_sp.AAC.1